VIQLSRRFETLAQSARESPLRAPRQIEPQGAVDAMHALVVPAVPLAPQSAKALPEARSAGPLRARGEDRLLTKSPEHLHVSGGALFAVAVKEGEEFQPGAPRKLFTFPRDATGGASVEDGSRTLVNIATGQRPRDIRLILDWTALLGR
jgi:hypothetical protein